MNLIIEIVVLFVILLIYFSSLSGEDNNTWIRALILGAGISLLGLLPVYMGGIGWLIAFVVAIGLIMKVTGDSFPGALLFLIVLGIVQYIIQLGIHKYL